MASACSISLSATWCPSYSASATASSLNKSCSSFCLNISNPNSRSVSLSWLGHLASPRPISPPTKFANRDDGSSSFSTRSVPPVEDKEERKDTVDASAVASSSGSILSFLCPLLKLLSAGDPSLERNYSIEVGASSLSSFARYPWGSKSLSDGSDNQNIGAKDTYVPLQLFEFEACPFCRRVREALTELDLSVEVYPCPKGSVKHREIVRSTGGKELFPFLIDPNTGVSMYESDKIVKYLFSQYGNGRPPSTGLLESTVFTGWMPTLLRAGRGMTLWEKANKESPPKKLRLFSYENNPYARIVREALCELEIPYLLQNVGEGSARAKLLLDASGSKEIPYFIDPNTGTQLGDYKKILDYLFKTYSSASF